MLFILRSVSRGDAGIGWWFSFCDSGLDQFIPWFILANWSNRICEMMLPPWLYIRLLFEVYWFCLDVAYIYIYFYSDAPTTTLNNLRPRWARKLLFSALNYVPCTVMIAFIFEVGYEMIRLTSIHVFCASVVGENFWSLISASKLIGTRLYMMINYLIDRIMG